MKVYVVYFLCRYDKILLTDSVTLMLWRLLFI